MKYLFFTLILLTGASISCPEARAADTNDVRAWLTNSFRPWLTRSYPEINSKPYPEWFHDHPPGHGFGNVVCSSYAGRLRAPPCS